MPEGDFVDQTAGDVVTGVELVEGDLIVRRMDGTTSTIQIGTTITSEDDAFGYATGSGSAVVQGTSKATGVTIDTPNGKITTHGAALNAGVAVGFTVTCAAVDADDNVVINLVSGGTVASYAVYVDAVAAGSFHVTIRNFTGGNLTETLVLHYGVIKGVAA